MTGEEVSELRTVLEIRMTDLARELGVTIQTVRSAEQPGTRMWPRTTQRYMTALLAIAKRQAEARRRADIAGLMATLVT
jgi:DNA-binding transcriptional regulator YiaG